MFPIVPTTRRTARRDWPCGADVWERLKRARRDPGAGDWRARRQHVLDRARPERRDAFAASLDAPPPVAGLGAASAASAP